jgi:hypothetical protein
MVRKHVITEQQASQVHDWFQHRGGIAIWRSCDLATPSKTWTTPLLSQSNALVSKPHWSAEDKPIRIITDPHEVAVAVDKEIQRFHVAIRPARGGFMLKCTAGASRRINLAVAKAGEGAYHTFDHSTQEAVIMAPIYMVLLPDWNEWGCQNERAS